MLKLKKWVLKALKSILVGYNGYTIYQIYLKNQRKVIQEKDVQIFKDYKNKFANNLLNYNKDTQTF